MQESLRLAKNAQAAKARAAEGPWGGDLPPRAAVMPYTWHLYNNYWQHPAPAPRRALTLADARHEFLLPLQSGADGLFVWGAVADAPTDTAEMRASDHGAAAHSSKKN